MARLLTDDQAIQIARAYAPALVGEIYLARPLPFADDEYSTHIREAIEHDLATCLEGLTEPEGGEC